MSRARISGLLFLALSLAYGHLATAIPTLPIDEFEAMTARSLPFFLSALGVVLSTIMIFRPKPEVEAASTSGSMSSGEWQTVLLLLLAIVVYSSVLDWVGFLLGTALFLASGFAILGERRWAVIVGVSLSLVGTLWLVLVPGLGIYLAPGRVFGVGG